MNRDERKERREALEDLKDGYINIDRWKRLLQRDRLFLESQAYKCRERLKELNTEHDELVNHLVTQFGEFKKVVRMTTGEAFKVPTRDIIEKGILEQDLDQYPKWED